MTKTITLQRPGSAENSIRTIDGELHGMPFHLVLDTNKPTQRLIFDCIDAQMGYEQESTAAIVDELRPGEMFFDVGANCGWFSMVAACCGARVIAFEPMSVNCNALLQNAPNAMVVRAIVSDVLGELPLYVNLDNDGGHALWPVGMHPFNADTLKAWHPRMRVQSVRLDDYAEHAPAVIKIDTEGAECNVLLGAETVLANPSLRMVVCERNLTGLQAMNHSPEEVLSIMQRHGFTWNDLKDQAVVENWIFRR